MKILQSNDLQPNQIYFDIYGKKLKIVKLDGFYFIFKENDNKQFEPQIYHNSRILQNTNWLNGCIAFESWEDYLLYNASINPIKNQVEKSVDEYLSDYLLKFLETKRKFNEFEDDKKFINLFKEGHPFTLRNKSESERKFNDNVFKGNLEYYEFHRKPIESKNSEVEDLKNRLEKAVKTNNNFAKVLWLLSAGFIAFGYFIK